MLSVYEKPPAIILLAEAGGGVARHVIDLYFSLKAKGWFVTLVVSPVRMEEMYREETLSIPGEDLHYVKMARGASIRDIEAVRKLKDLLKGRQSRVVLHAHSTKAGIFGAILRDAVDCTVFTPHAYRSIDPNLSRTRRAAIRSVERLFSRTYDRVIAVSREELRYAEKLGLNKERLRHIPNGLCLERYVTARQRSRRELRTVGFVGRLVAQKNPLLFIRTFARLRERFGQLEAIVAGDGPLRSMLQVEASRLGLADRIKWLGTHPAVDAFKDFDVMIHTSTYEAMPYSLIEAAASHLPIVATRNHGSLEVLGDLIPERVARTQDPNELAAIVVDLFSSEAALDHHIAALDLIARRFALQNMVCAIETEYCDLLELKDEVGSRSPLVYG